MAPTLTILHVSDLHFDSEGDFDRQIVIKALLADLMEHRANGIQFDAVVFSGDLVYAGSNKTSYQLVTERFLDPLLAAAGLPRAQLVIVPGNHDIDKSEVVSFVETGLKAELSSVEQINSFIDGALLKSSWATESALARMSKFDVYYRSLNLGAHISENSFFRTRIIPIRGLNVGFACMNSAWRATGQAGDKGNLVIGERAVDVAINDLANADLKVCVAHHPPEWLLESDSIAVENRLYTAFDLICLGHTHRSLPNYRVTPLGNSVISQAGTLYAGRKYFNGYQIIQWNEADRKVTFHCRMYLDDARRKFVQAENVSPGGIFQLDLKPRTDKGALTEIELFLRQARPVIRRSANEHISFTRSKDSHDLEEITEAFVCQPLALHLETESLIGGETDAQRSARELDADAILRSSDDVVLLGDAETGRTSLLHYLAVRASEGVCDKIRIPAVVSVPLLVRSGGYERAIKGYYSDADFVPSALNSAIKMLPWIVFLDDFNAAKQAHLDELSAARKRFPLHRFVVVTHSSSVRLLETTAGLKPVKVDIGYLSRRNIRQLSRIRYAGTLESGLDDPAYTLVMRQINDARLPRTGYMVTLLLWAAEQNKLGENLNEAVLLENLISFLLGKTNFEAALRNQFDPRAQEFLLRAIANELKKMNGWLESNKLLEFIILYFESRGLAFGAKEVLAEFIACRLLHEQDGYIAFRYPCYQEYFVAVDLLHDASKFAALLSASNDTLLNHTRELDLWSSLARELHGIDEVLIRILESSDLGLENLIGDLSDLKFVGKELRLKRSRVRELLESPPTKDQIDELLDKAEQARNPAEVSGPPKAGSAENKAVASRKAASNFMIQRAALDLFTRVARNCDHEKLDAKRRVTLSLLRLWSSHTYKLLTTFFEALNTNREAVIKKSELTSDDLDRIGNILSLVLVFSDTGRIANVLTAESLRDPLKEIATNAEQSEGVRFLAGMAYSETWDDKGISLVRDLVRSLKSDLLKHAAVGKMLNDYRLQRYRRSSAGSFRELIVECQIALGVPKNKKGSQIAALQQAEKEDG